MTRKLTTRHGVLKWYSPERRYGFVRLAEPEEDALLHVSCLDGFDVNLLVKGAIVDCECAFDDTKGWSIQKINSIAAGDPSAVTEDAPILDGEWVRAHVKWYNDARGYGFVTRGPNTPDIFIHATTRKAGPLVRLIPNMEVQVIIEPGPNGLKATAVRGV